MSKKHLGFTPFLWAGLFLALTFAAAEIQQNVRTVAADRARKGFPDVAYSPADDLYLVVWHERLGGPDGDRDVRAKVLKRDGSPASNVILLASSGEDERLPRVAGAGAGGWTVVWSTGRSIESCVVDTTGRADGFRSVTSSTRPVDRPDIGGPDLDGRSLVVWEESGELGLSAIKGRWLGPLEGERGDEFVLIRDSYASLHAPAVNKIGRRFFVAWEKHVDIKRVDIEGREAPDGPPSSEGEGDRIILAADGARNIQPSVASFPGSDAYIVVWQRLEGRAVSDIAFVQAAGGEVRVAGRVTDTPAFRESRPSVASAGPAGRVLMTYQSAPAADPRRRDAVVRTIGWGDPFPSQESALDPERREGGNPASVRAAGAGGRGLVVWDVNEGEGRSILAREWATPELSGESPGVVVSDPIIILADVMISGTVTFNGFPQSNVLMSGLPGEPRTDASGGYAAAVPAGWTGTVVPALPGFTFTPPSRTYTNLAVEAPGENYAAAFAGGAEDRYENNDDLVTAAALPLGTTRDLVLNDEDWFKVYIPAEDAGKDLRVRLFGTGFPDTTSGRDLDFAVLDPSGTLAGFCLSSNADETAFVCDVVEGWYTIANIFVTEGTVYAITAETSDAFGLGFVTGQVTDDVGAPVEGATVELFGEPFYWDVTRTLVVTDASGAYKVGALPGNYTVRFNMSDWNDQYDWTPDANFIGMTYNYGEIVTLGEGATLENIDAELSPGGAISGRITDGSGTPFAGASQAMAHGSDFLTAGRAFADSNGDFVINRLRAGNFAVRLRTPGGVPLLNEWHDDQVLFGSSDIVGVASGSLASVGVAQLAGDEAGAIAGRVTDAVGDPVANLQVTICDPAGLSLWSARTNENGEYAIGVVPSGEWKVLFNAASIGDPNLVSEYFPDALTLAEAATVTVAAGQTTTGVDASLAPAGAIAGTVSNNAGYLNVYAFDTSSDFMRSVVATYYPTYAPVGTVAYTISNLPPGTYRVEARPSQQGDRLLSWYPASGSYAGAGDVIVAAGATTGGIDITLASGGGSIAGRVTDGAGTGIPGVTVRVEDASKPLGLGSGLSDADGNYTVRYIPAGPAKVLFNTDAGWSGYTSEYYNDKSAQGDADAVTVNEGETTFLADAVLALRPALTSTTTPLPGGEIAVPYDQQLTAAGGREFYRWTVVSGALPEGLVLTTRGRIHGTPTLQGVFPFTVQVTDSTVPQQAQQQELSITVGAYSGSGYTVRGLVTAEGAPLAGVALTGLPGEPVTNAAGAYAAVVPSGWSGTVTASLLGYAFSPASRSYANVASDFEDQDYAAEPGYMISGTVTFGGTGQANVQMAGLPGEPLTDASGAYAATVPAGWSGTVTPTLTGFMYAPSSRTYTGIAADETGQDYEATFNGGVDDAFEENDDLASAAIVPLGTTTGLILNDEDWFKVYVPAEDAGKDLRIHLWGTGYPDTTTRRDLDFYVLDGAGTALSVNISGSDDETAYICDVEEGWYYIAHTYVGLEGTVYSLAAETNADFGLGYIMGTVRDDEGNVAQGVGVELYGMPFNWDVSRPQVFTDASGRYLIGYTPGAYTVQLNINTPNDDWDWTPDANYIGETYNGGEVLNLTAGATVPDIDARLTPGGMISGRITDSSGNPLNMALAYAYAGDTVRVSYDFTDANGNYVMRKLRTGNYAVRFRAPGGSPLATEWYADGAAFAAAMPVPVTAGETTAGIDASLVEGGCIRGQVTSHLGEAFVNVQVTAYDEAGIAIQTSYSDDAGDYLIGRLPAGTYRVYFNASTSSDAMEASEYYPDKRFLVEAEGVAVTVGQTTSGIDAELAQGGSISGRVTDPSGLGLVGINVGCFDADSDFFVSATTDAMGNYTIRNLDADAYKVRFRPSPGVWATEWWDDKASLTGADVVTVLPGQALSRIDAALSTEFGVITGRVTDGLGAGIDNVTVVAQDTARAAGYVVTATNAEGYYSLPSLPTCQAKVQFNADLAYLDRQTEYYNEKGDHGGADPIAVTAGETTSGIDAVLAARPALTVTTASLPGGELAVEYGADLAASGGRTLYHWSLESGSLPEGLTLNGRGEITGTPTMAGTFVFKARVSDSTAPQQAATRELSITIGEYTGVGYTISGAVTTGETPLAGVTMSGLPGSPVTNAAGGYVAVVPSGWNGTATPILSGYAFTPASITYANVSTDSDEQDYAAVAGYTISGTVTLLGAGLPGVLMSGLPGDPRTDEVGHYSAAVAAGSTLTVTPTLPGFTFTPESIDYTGIAADQPGQDYVAAYAGGVDDPFEDNDSFETAAELPLGTTRDLIFRDVDWFKIYVPAAGTGQDLRVHIWGMSFPDPSIRKDLDFYVRDAAGRALSLNLSGSPDETAYICDVAEGWYYIGQTYIGLEGTVYSLSVDVNEDFGLGYVEGTVRDDGGAPIPGVSVELYAEPFDWDISRPLIYTDASGHYRIGYVPGPYTVRFNLASAERDDLEWTPDANFLGEVYHGGEVLQVAPGATLSSIDGQLTEGGTIAGRITDAAGNPCLNIWVYAHAGDTILANYTLTNADGNYVLNRLRTGNYAVRFRPTGAASLAVEWYDDAGTFAEAMPVPVQAGVTTGGIDLSFGVPGSISGYVRNGSGEPISGVTVNVYDQSGIAIRTGGTDETGFYFVGRLPTGTFKVQFNAATVMVANYISEYYTDQLLLADAVPVSVTVPNTTTGIDAVLDAGGTISGAVTSGGNAIAGIEVRAFAVASDLNLTATTNEMGVYTIRNVPAGDYKVRFRPPTGTLAVEWFGDKADYTAANALAVDVGQDVTGVDADLSDVSATITGRVTDGVGAGIAGVTVIAQDTAKTAAYSTAITDEDGNYSLGRLPTCQTKVYFSTEAAYLIYANEYYNDELDHESADSVSVTAGEITSDIDATLIDRPALAVTTETLPAGELGVVYSGDLTASGGRPLYHWSLETGALPDGLTLNGRGEITGTPTMAGTFVFTARVSDSTAPQHVATRELSITVGQFTGVGYTISGKVLFGGQPLAGVTIGGLPGEPLTNADGGYVAVVTDGWSGTATPALAGYIFEPVSYPYSNVTASLAGQDFVASLGYTVSGIVSLNASPLEGVLMDGLPGSPLTDTMGYYAAGVPPGWSGTVTPALDGYTFDPVNRAYLNVSANYSDHDYAATAISAPSVRVDFNQDGQEDILWRYYGSGDYQGLNVIWLMSQTESPETMPLSMAAAGSAPGSPVPSSIAKSIAPLKTDLGSLRPRGTEPGVKSFMAKGKSRSPSAKMRLASPLDAGRKSSAKGRKALPAGRFSSALVRKDAAASGVLSSGTAQIASMSLAQEIVFSQIPDTGWEIAGTGDFNGDSKTDILWRYYGTGPYQGLNDIWFMDGTTFMSEAVFSQIPDTNWRVAGTGDFNGDGETDILWRYYGTGAYQGLNVIWYMNDATFIGESVFSQVLDTDWRIEGTGDFNGDGETDILWRYYGTGAYQGLNDIWYMNDEAFVSEAVFSQILDTNWQIGGTGDFNNDGHTDILWRYYGTGAYQGLNDIWYMDGTTFVSEEVFSLISDTNWKIVNR